MASNSSSSLTKDSTKTAGTIEFGNSLESSSSNDRALERIDSSSSSSSTSALTPISKSESDLDKITLRVMTNDGREIFFKVKKTTPLRRMFTAYCETTQTNPKNLRFIIDGQRVDSQTELSAEKLGLEDNDVIDVLLEQTGGGRS